MPLIEHALPHTDIIMSSIEEARKYTGKDEPEQMAEQFEKLGVETVLIKLGGDGLLAKNGEKVLRIAAHKVSVVDTTGAGDAACAGFLYGYVHGWDLERSAKLANAVGGLTVQKMGGAEAIRSLEHTVEFMEGRGTKSAAV
jgi:sugar/nucleoside kinase (ribokinase family)